MRATSATPASTAVTRTDGAGQRSRSPSAGPPPNNTGVSTRSTTTARSWSRSTPIASWPCGECAWLCRVSSLMTIAVLESATKIPSTIRRRTPDAPSAAANAMTTAAVTTICAAPPEHDASPRAAQAAHREIEPGGEEQQRDPDLGEHLDVRLRADDPQPGRARDHAGSDQGDDRRHPEAARDHEQRQRDGIDEDEFLEKSAVGHLFSRVPQIGCRRPCGCDA